MFPTSIQLSKAKLENWIWSFSNKFCSRTIFTKNKRIFLKCGHVCHEKSRPSNVCYSRGFYRSDQGALQRLWCFVPSPAVLSEYWTNTTSLKTPHSPLKGFLQKLVNTLWVVRSCLQVLSLVHRHFFGGSFFGGYFFFIKTSSRESFGNNMTHRSSLVSLRKRNVSTAIVLWIINTNGNDLGHAKMSRSFIFYTTRKVTCGKTFQPFRLVFGQTFFGFMEKFYKVWCLNSERIGWWSS